jgi:AhpD family alkylhydroperoxidase
MTTNTEHTAYVKPTVRLAVDDLAPGIAKAMNGLERAVGESSIDKPLREMVKLRASQINGCVYCVDMHSRDAVAGGDTWRRLNLVAVWREAPYFTARERAALALTEAVTRLSDGPVREDVWAAAAEEFEETELAELVWLITTINAWNRVSVAAQAWPVNE